MPDAANRARNVVASSACSCDQNEVSCAGLLRTGRIPLENELSDDGDAYESSWRHYLSLAADAAAEADRLGEAWIDVGFTSDERTEEAWSAVEDECGDVGELANEFGMASGVGGSCVTDGACETGERCLAGHCFATPSKQLLELADDDPRAARLAACLGVGDGAVVPWATLGPSPLCMWRRTDPVSGEMVYCEPIEGAPRCPYKMDQATGSCSTPPESGGTPPDPEETEYELVPVTDTLGLTEDMFHTEGADEDTLNDVCNAIRGAWSSSGLREPTIAAQIRNKIPLAQLQQIAMRAGWTAQAMNLSFLTIDGNPWTPRGPDHTTLPYAGTGNVIDGFQSNTAWPCGAVPDGVQCDANPKALFCQRRICDNPHDRALINDRMARAVLALKVSTASSMNHFVSPYWQSNSHAEWHGGITDAAGAIPPWPTQTWNLVTHTHVVSGSTCDATCLGARDYYGTAYCWGSDCDGSCPSIWSVRDVDGNWIDISNGCASGLDPRIFVAFDAQRLAGADPVNGLAGDRASELVPLFWAGVIGEEATPQGVFADRTWLWNRVYKSLQGGIGRADYVVMNHDSHWITQLTNYFGYNNENAVAIAGVNGSRPTSGSFSGGLTSGNFVDALELACEMARSGASECDPSAPVPEVGAIRDLPGVKHYFECVATSVEDQVEYAVISNVPRAAVRGLAPAVGGTGFGEPQGTYGANVLRYNAALQDLRSAVPEIARIVRAIARNIEEMQILLDQLNIQNQTRLLDVFSTVSSMASRCGAAIFDALGRVQQQNYYAIGSAVSQCADSTMQMIIAVRRADLEGQASSNDLRTRITELNQSFDDRMGAMNEVSRQLQTAVSELEASAVDLQTHRTSASRALAMALGSDTTEGGRLLRTNTVLRRQNSTARTRYFNALADAQRLAFLARIAVEQELGMNLNSIQQDMSLVENPSAWADSVCTITGLDYSRISDASDTAYENYADQYIGDYVRRLERVVESYRIDYPFQDGADTAVLSLRDDILGIRTECLAPGGNLLVASNDLDVTADLSGNPVWEVLDCAVGEGPCVSRRRMELAREALPFADWSVDFDQASAFEITFEQTTGTSRVTSNTRVEQRVWLEGGRYRLSWYVQEPGTPAADLELSGDLGGLVSREGTPFAATAGGWKRHFVIFDVPIAQTVRISLHSPDASAPSNQVLVVTAPMLEALGQTVDGDIATLDADDHKPLDYRGSDLTGAVRSTCVDQSGQAFRERAWTRHCQQLCPGGFDQSCLDALQYCYWESTFRITAEELLDGRFVRGAGFARGNYNYRIDGIGLNFVGSASRDCSSSGSPDTCYSNGWIPYSILHRGGHQVIDYLGNTDYLAPIYPGRVENVRGLAAERYLTNPLSSADRALMDDYMRRELRGRPLPGEYVVRVWDAPGVNFTGVEDVQIVLDYRFWTRQQ